MPHLSRPQYSSTVRSSSATSTAACQGEHRDRLGARVATQSDERIDSVDPRKLQDLDRSCRVDGDARLDPDPFEPYFLSPGFRVGDPIIVSGQAALDDCGELREDRRTSAAGGSVRRTQRDTIVEVRARALSELEIEIEAIAVARRANEQEKGAPRAPFSLFNQSASGQGSVTFAMNTSSSGCPLALRFRVSDQFG